MKLMNMFKANQPSDAEIQQQNHFQMLLIFKSFFAMLVGEESLQSVGEMSSALVETRAFDLAAQHLKRNSDCAALIRDRYIPPAHNLDKLLTYPQNSLGYIYAATMKKAGLDHNLHIGMTAVSDAQYVELRLSQTHDIWHIVTGFDTSAIGEIGLQAFHLPQFPYPLATMLVANSLMSSTLLAPEELSQLLEAIAQGWQMGKTAKPLFAQKWEEVWDKPLAQWQAEVNIQPIQNR
ncbi:ubiquinone biosynthesis protein [Scytonema hofmannii PCC 7110]|uniref:Ubiquinone biosynthesis protein n=1 Tax=Scytonema hofmannii PCC 7110 TaxID=128403 RepID=A0A139XES4_9CYAN|nr:Coq4 family protein [Scytonema hofmannii]KYC43122.1 ubiquinone biosynthesis protein [Scytonema hofmannii PCC 7110]